MGADNLVTRSCADSVARVSVYLHAGQVFASRAPCEITTVLGSCVSVVLLDASKRIGGANHYLLPMDGGGHTPSLRFGNVAIAELVAGMLAQGSRKGDLVAKVFGGASTSGLDHADESSLGGKNVQVARQKLAETGIPIVAEDVCGRAGRKLVVFTDEGHVWVKKL